ncbi:MAG: hypothetical protein A3J76_02275 [Candidatus Moranbacteria bacterium RBG_13_45_13]|nr:MAG: hypothetical protein A3J76_02275 [Candidatus Moranbacteria bacterium RBG_13_45_13]
MGVKLGVKIEIKFKKYKGERHMKSLREVLLLLVAAVCLSGCAVDYYNMPRVDWTAPPPDVVRRSAYLDRQLQDLQRQECDQRMARETEGRTLAREDFNNGRPMGARAPFTYEGRNAYFQEWQSLDWQYQARLEDNARKQGEADYLCRKYGR